MNILSLFDGISCARVALERAGIPVEAYYASEIDKYAIQISQKNYPDIIQVGSVVDVHLTYPYQEYGVGESPQHGVSYLGEIDLLIGGSPCQDLSIAKKDRKGLGGERSGLFWEYVRILKEVKPKYFILENVNSMPKEAKALITETLGVEPVMIDAALVSAQRRKRLWWVGKWNGEKYEQVVIPQPDDRGILLKDILEDIPANDIPLKEKSKTIRSGGRASGLGDKHEWDSVYQYRRTYTANMGTGGNDVPYVKDVKEMSATSQNQIRKNTKTGDEKALALTGNSNFTGSGVTTVSVQDDGTLKVREATKAGFAIAKDGDAVDLSFPNSATRRGRAGNKAKNLMTSSGGIHAFTQGQLRKLTPLECERLQSLPDGYTEGVSTTQRYKALGNAFNVEVVSWILSFLLLD